MNLIWVVAGFIGLLWLTQVLVRRGMDDGQYPSGVAQWRHSRVAIDGVGEVRDSGYRLAYRRAITNF